MSIPTEKTNLNSAYLYMSKSDEETIVREHEQRIRFTALPFLRHGVSIDDLMQEGRLALILASRNWKADRGASIWTYARRFVLGAMFSTVGKALTEIVPGGDQATEVPDGALSAEERASLLELLDMLSPRERHIVVSHLCVGKTIGELVGELGLSTGTVWNVCDAAVTKMRAAAGATGAAPATVKEAA